MVRRYIRRCKELFPVYGKYERQFLKRLKNEVTEYITQSPNLTYEELIAQFGSPKDIVMGYYDTVDDDYLLKKTNFVKTVRHFLIIIIAFIILFTTYRSYIIYQAYLDARDTVIIQEETVIEDLGPVDSQ